MSPGSARMRWGQSQLQRAYGTAGDDLLQGVAPWAPFAYGATLAALAAVLLLVIPMPPPESAVPAAP